MSVKMKNGEHAWAEYPGGNNLIVVIKTDDEYFVAGDWYQPIKDEEIDIIQVLNKPVGYENEGCYYCMDTENEGEA